MITVHKWLTTILILTDPFIFLLHEILLRYTMNHFDAIVVGVGGVGSMALRGLAKRGSGGKFLGIERFSRCHSKGSSHGRTRLYRKAYFEHPQYVPWLEYSVLEFRQLQKDSGQNLLQECGTLILEHVPASQQGQLPQYCQASMDSALEHNIPVEELSMTDLKQRYPQFCYKYDMVGVLEPGGGFVRPERVQQEAIKEALDSGYVELLENAQVKSWKYNGQTNSVGRPVIELTLIIDPPQEIKSDVDADRSENSLFNGNTEREKIAVTTNSLLISAGAWSGQLIPTWTPLLAPTRQLQGWIDTLSSPRDDHEANDIRYGYEEKPGWVMSTPDYPLPLYGVPADSDDPEYGHEIKIGIHGRDEVLNDPLRNDPHVSKAEMNELETAARAALNVPDSPERSFFSQVTPCIYTMTKDSHFLIGSPHKQVFAVAGLSGHGFKQTPALGAMMSDFGLDFDLSRWNFDFCSPERFGVTPV